MAILLNKIRSERRKRKKIRRMMITVVVLRKRFLLRICSILCFLLQSLDKCYERPLRSCRRHCRNMGWWDLVWRTYDDTRFKKTFRVSRQTFNYILDNIRMDITKDIMSETPISPECRLAVCLYRLGRGDYLYTIAELFGLGVSTVHGIIVEVSQAIINNFWKTAVQDIFPTNVQQFTEKILDMDQLWQFPCTWGAIDGCHLPIQCPPGGQEARKEYHNFKNFYSIVMMAIIDAQDRFVWVSIGFPGNSHDSVIFTVYPIMARYY